jgi:hypothetical protein
MPDDQSVARIDEQIAELNAMAGERGELTLEVESASHRRVHVLVRKRGRRYRVSDRSSAMPAGGNLPRGWLEVARRVADEEGMNVSRDGVVYVPAVEGRDIARLVQRVADASSAVSGALLDLQAAGR